jgi:catechol 2,3-dioxygenase
MTDDKALFTATGHGGTEARSKDRKSLRDSVHDGGTGRMNVGVRPGGYRLPDAARIGAVRLRVSDLARSLVYYTTVLGLRVLSQTGSMAVLGRQGSASALVELHERRGIRPVPRRGLLGLYHFAILLPDRESLGRFVTQLAEVGAHAGSADHAVSEALYLSDPDGLGIEVYADRPRAQWRANGREIAMTTEPLDLRNLVRAAAGQPWTGMPAGTAIGHVHFHVGAIREAEGFYHSALGFDKMAWTYPGALFMSAGGYHHHVGTNIWAAGSPAATSDDARLLEWELVLPSAADVDAAAASAAGSGHNVQEDGADRLLTDPWGITVRIVRMEADATRTKGNCDYSNDHE